MKSEKEDKVVELEKEIWQTFRGRGEFAHNVIQYSLKALAKLDKELADKVYKELIEKGY